MRLRDEAKVSECPVLTSKPASRITLLQQYDRSAPQFCSAQMATKFPTAAVLRQGQTQETSLDGVHIARECGPRSAEER